MLDINLIREKKEEVTKALLKRMDSVDLGPVIELDDKRKKLILEADTLKAKRNDVSAQIPKLKKQGHDVSALIEEMKGVGDRIKALDEELTQVKTAIQEQLDGLPNLPDESVPAGGKENNQVISVFGSKPDFSFKPKDHVDLAVSLGLIDYERGVKMGGNGFWLYKNKGALLEWALLNYFVESHVADGYEFVLPPHILNYQCGYAAGQFPKFENDVFHLEPEDEGKFTHFLLPTAETALINYHRDEILKEEDLPKKYFAYTPCYRKEAGSYRAEERGMIRGHQFNKVEMFQYTKPEDSKSALEELIGKVEKLMKGLELHYQVSKLAAKDCSASMAMTYDVEVWIPSMNVYKEVSSASNSKDYQPRRANIRYKNKATGKNEYLHALNASGIATSRLFPAILEQHQTAEGKVKVPELLRKWVGCDFLE
ncbi:MAG: serine--tRNA ligase [Spirochaetales bacterium]|nr:serine--tRNA ligase [Spirochaetales bacterium]